MAALTIDEVLDALLDAHLPSLREHLSAALLEQKSLTPSQRTAVVTTVYDHVAAMVRSAVEQALEDHVKGLVLRMAAPLIGEAIVRTIDDEITKAVALGNGYRDPDNLDFVLTQTYRR